MIQRIVQVRKHEWRAVGLLGSYILLMLAITTLIAAASDALFVDRFGAQYLAVAIGLAQLVAIVGFAGYRQLRRLVPQRWVNPVITLIFLALFGVMFLLMLDGVQEAVFALVVFAPLLSGVLGSEYGRLSASMVDARSARRLLPLLGAIGGAGASLGAFSMSLITDYWSTDYAIAAALGLLCIAVIPPMYIRESQRPRVATATATAKDVFSHRYARLILLAGAVLIAVSTIVRVQFGAMVTEHYEGAEVGLFYADFYFWLNVASIAFALFGTSLAIKWLGAARTLLLYPSAMVAVSLVATQFTTILLAAGTQFVERLFRQNLHNTASTICNMPVPVHIRIRQALLSSGSVKPVAVLTTTALLYLTFGEQSLLSVPLTWSNLYWPVAVLSTFLLGMMIFVWRSYPLVLAESLSARRLRMEGIGEEGEDELLATMDGDLRTTLLGYLRSELPERAGLALELLNTQADREVAAVVRDSWLSWPDWLKVKAASLLAQFDDKENQSFMRGVMRTESGVVCAAVIRGQSDVLSGDECWAIANEKERSLQEVQAAIEILAGRGDVQLEVMIEDWLSPPNSPDLDEWRIAVLAGALHRWPDGRFDHGLAHIFDAYPGLALSVLQKRPDASWGQRCVNALNSPETFDAAQAALATLGDDAVPLLEDAAQQALAFQSSFHALCQTEGHKAHLAGMRLMSSQRQAVRNRASKARLLSSFDVSAAELKVAEQNVEEALAQAERFHAYTFQTQGIQQAIARSERGAALEDLFVNLSITTQDGPFRDIYLALNDGDNKQRALAAELLDAHLPNSVTNRLEPILENTPVRGKFDRQADRDWLLLEERLDAKVTSELRLRDLKLNKAFQDWRVAELEGLAAVADRDYRPVPVVLRDQDIVGIEHTLLSGSIPDLEVSDEQIPLDQLYSSFRASPRCGYLWLQTLAGRMPQQEAGQAEITRSSMVSLASRAIGDDHAAAADQDLWQRMFFLRSTALGQNLPPRRLRLLAGICKPLQGAKGQVVVNERRLGHHFYLLCTGAAEVSQSGRVVTSLGPSEGFGVLALFQGMRRPMTVTLTQNSELLAISRIDFLDLLELHPELVRSFARNIADQILSLQA
ncbi:MAG: cyclic nucleotide-binding domain-containing protein [Pseudomonadota bacterium]